MNRNFDTEALLKSPLGGPLPLIPTNADDVTKSDTTVFTPSMLYVGSTGDVKVKTSGGQSVIFAGVPAGTFIPVYVTMVYSTDTTASDFLRLW